MLCSNCQSILVHAIESRIGGKGRIHDSLQSFHRSIVAGCLICTQWWYFIEGKRHDNAGRTAIGINADIKSESKDFQTARDIVLRIKHETSTNGVLSTALQHEKASDNKRSVLMPYQISELDQGEAWMVIGSDHPSWENMHFSIVADFEEGLPDLPNEYDHQVLGTSTAAMSEIWKDWLRNCYEFHPLCRTPTTAVTSVPTRLIQLLPGTGTESNFTWRLTRHDKNCRVKYATLSHCWGKSEHMKLTRANCQSVFNNAHQTDLLPKTYRQAFEIAWKLGFQYIWIDSLCIIQDDLDDWREQASKMGIVYSNGSCNIAAAFAEDGEQGCYNQRDPATVSATTFLCRSNQGSRMRYNIALQHMYHEQTVDTPLGRRAWVVQERCLAPRQLSFGQHQVFWECTQLSACEQFPKGIPKRLQKSDLTVSPVEKPTLALTSQYDLLQSWCSLVEHYTMCELSKKSDKTVAIAGLAAEYSRRTGDTYLAGLWKRELHKQLCWRWNFQWEIMADPHVCLRARRYQGPTWSWLSMDGPVDTVDWTYDPSQRSACFLRLLNDQIVSKDPEDLHSFVSCEIEIQAIALHIAPLHHGSNYNGDDEDPDGVDLEVRISSMEQQAIVIEDARLIFDERVPLSKRSSHPEQWARIQRLRRESDMLLVLATGHFEPSRTPDLCGIVLGSKITDSQWSRGPVYVRMGVIDFQCAFLTNLLTTRLALEAETQLVSALDLDDPRISDLVQTVRIV